MTPLAPARMTSPLLRLFAVCWWLVVIGSAGFALFGTAAVWGDYHVGGIRPSPDTGGLDPGSPRPDPSWHVAAGAIVLLFSLLPFIIMAVIRWIAISRWRFGPRW